MNEKILSSYFRKHLVQNEKKFIEQVPFKKKRIDFVVQEKEEQIYTYELKVSNWNSVFNQACKNLLFSDKSYICFWYTFEDRIDIDLAKKYNIGLYLLKKNDILEIFNPYNNNKYLKPKYYRSFKKKILNSINNESLLGD